MFNIKKLCILLFFTTFSSEVLSLSLAVENSWPPYATKQGRGYSIDIVKAAFKLSNITPNISVVPYSRALSLAKTGEKDGCFNVTKQSSTNANYHFGLLPIFQAGSYLYSRPSKNYKYTSLKDLPDGFKIGVIKGYEYGDKYEKEKKRFKEVRVSTQKQILGMLTLGRIDGAIFFDRVAKYTIIKNKLDEADFIQRFLIHTSDIYVAFNKNNIKSKYYSDMLDKGITQLKKKNKISEIFKRVVP